jgi:hypothetical protein
MSESVFWACLFQRDLQARIRHLEDTGAAEDAVLQASVALQRTRAAKPADEDEDTDEYCEWQDALWRALEAHKEAVDALLAAEADRGDT